MTNFTFTNLNFMFLIFNTIILLCLSFLSFKIFSIIKSQNNSKLIETIEKKIDILVKNEINTLSMAIRKTQDDVKDRLHLTIMQSQEAQSKNLHEFTHKTQNSLQDSLLRLQSTLRESTSDLNLQVKDTLERLQKELGQQFDKLNRTTEERLTHISDNVETRLNKGFEKTSETFTNIIKRLAIIDDAQKKITDLSTNVVSLQEILHDKRSRGAFGEIQLNALIHNVLPQENYAIQHVLSNDNRVDCMLFLPEPTGDIAIDAKFPLENFRIFTDFNRPESEKIQAKQQFRQDIKKHIQDISTKYIIPGETASGALMFIPAEAVFAEIHAHFPDLVEIAQRSNVWMTSPTTLMAVLTTASAVLKDSATRKQVHIIQEHIRFLAKDFSRFEKRMENLSKHIQKANVDADQIHTSAKKITNRFEKIEKVDLEDIQLEQAEISSLMNDQNTANKSDH